MSLFSSKNWKTQRKRDSGIVTTDLMEEERKPKPKPRSRKKPAPKKAKPSGS